MSQTLKINKASGPDHLPAYIFRQNPVSEWILIMRSLNWIS